MEIYINRLFLNVVTVFWLYKFAFSIVNAVWLAIRSAPTTSSFLQITLRFLILRVRMLLWMFLPVAIHLKHFTNIECKKSTKEYRPFSQLNFPILLRNDKLWTTHIHTCISYISISWEQEKRSNYLRLFRLRLYKSSNLQTFQDLYVCMCMCV